ncbi:3-keto-5-aminohexanoate cleavage protein [Aminobacter sp. MSH1]|uniref:3-keto-5-aminohexanoate cleavage protein n=1 Tax=Aminobacter sp. MSH1 TaxID=374606 RepID=UPI00131F10DC|nr:3-keto-5-aminohexanoate cleavage protein [Aminobacter sp. MSH1]
MSESDPRKVILTCAVTGASLTPSMSPYLPITPEQIANEAIAAAKAGAAILHLHARDPRDGRPTRDLAVWREIVSRIRAGSDAIINMSASMGATVAERLEASLDLRPDIATVIVGSMNYGRFKKAMNQGGLALKYDWEKEMFGAGSYRVVTNNTFEKIGEMIDVLVDQNIGMEFEMYDVGHLYMLEYHLNRRPDIKQPLIIQYLTGILGGIPSNIEHLLHLKNTTEKLFGNSCEIFVHGTGTDNMRAATYGGLMGTNIRIGLEDNLIEREGVLYKSNEEQVRKIKRILREFAIDLADVDEARLRLNLPFEPAP